MLYKKDNRKTNFLSTKLKNILGYIFAVACSLTNIVMFFCFCLFSYQLDERSEAGPGKKKRKKSRLLPRWVIFYLEFYLNIDVQFSLMQALFSNNIKNSFLKHSAK